MSRKPEHMLSYNESLAIQMLQANILEHVANVEDDVGNGGFDYTVDYYNDLITLSGLGKYAKTVLNNSFRRGFLDSYSSETTIESKHLKSLGSEKLEIITGIAGLSAYAEIKKYI